MLNARTSIPLSKSLHYSFSMSYIEAKVNRHLAGEPLRVLDLFCGCGGLSLGFQKEGFNIVAGIEIDKEASRSHASNFHKDHPLFEKFAQPRDIRKITAASLLEETGVAGDPGNKIDIIIGGPPCQAFTRVGRAKLREVFSDDNAFLNDARSQLYKSYLEYVRDLAPLAILMENVPDMLNYGGVNIAELVCYDLVQYGYNCQYTLLNSVYFGVPQMRERMFLIAIHEDIGGDIQFPLPTNYAVLPKGYHGSRHVALKSIKAGPKSDHYIEPPRPDKQLPRAVSAKDALADLPVITDHLEGGLTRGMKKTAEKKKYKSRTTRNTYQLLMRNWPGFATKDEVSGNVIRYLPRDYPIFRKMKCGDQYPQAIAVAQEIFFSRLRKEEKKLGKPIAKRTVRYKRLVAGTIPPYDVNKFPNKWRKMEEDKPARTLMAHLGKDSYSHIHYDGSQARTISVREAARLQSFPDGFEFSGAMNAAFRQIGNAVPPLIAAKIARSIKKTIEIGIRCQQKTSLQD
jgi:DNA (cytosine-5)-methyltransferase 1